MRFNFPMSKSLFSKKKKQKKQHNVCKARKTALENQYIANDIDARDARIASLFIQPRPLIPRGRALSRRRAHSQHNFADVCSEMHQHTPVVVACAARYALQSHILLYSRAHRERG